MTEEDAEYAIKVLLDSLLTLHRVLRSFSNVDRFPADHEHDQIVWKTHTCKQSDIR